MGRRLLVKHREGRAREQERESGTGWSITALMAKLSSPSRPPRHGRT